MKSTLAIFLMICLQVAMSPFCLCFSAEVTEEVAPQTCCHAPEGSEPAPCPHCDQQQPIAATTPVKAAFGFDAPEWVGPSPFPVSDFPAVAKLPVWNVVALVKAPETLPLMPFAQEVLSVFLI